MKKTKNLDHLVPTPDDESLAAKLVGIWEFNHEDIGYRGETSYHTDGTVEERGFARFSKDTAHLPMLSSGIWKIAGGSLYFLSLKCSLRIGGKSYSSQKILTLDDRQFVCEENGVRLVNTRKAEQTPSVMPEPSMAVKSELEEKRRRAEWEKSFIPPTAEREGEWIVLKAAMDAKYVSSGYQYCKLNKWIPGYMEDGWPSTFDYEGPDDTRTHTFDFTLDDEKSPVELTLTKKGPDDAFPMILRVKASQGTALAIFNKLTNLVHRQRDNEQFTKAHLERDAVDKALAPLGVTFRQFDNEEVPLTEPIAVALLSVAEQLPKCVIFLMDLPRKNLSKRLKELIGRGLLKLFVASPGAGWELAEILYRLNAHSLGEAMIPLVSDARYGESRMFLISALAKSKHPKAAETIAPLLDDSNFKLRGMAAEALGKLKARQYTPKLLTMMKDRYTSKDVAKALIRMGMMPDTGSPPPPIHVVKNSLKPPAGYEEWSVNSDNESLKSTLMPLTTLIESGFGQREIDEIVGVAESLGHDKTKTFRFPIQFRSAPAELWVGIFMDDIDSPDIAIFGPKELITEFEPLADAVSERLEAEVAKQMKM